MDLIIKIKLDETGANGVSEARAFVDSLIDVISNDNIHCGMNQEIVSAAVEENGSLIEKFI